MPYYRENEHLLHLPNKAITPNFSVIKSSQSSVFSDNTEPPISVICILILLYAIIK